MSKWLSLVDHYDNGANDNLSHWGFVNWFLHCLNLSGFIGALGALSGLTNPQRLAGACGFV